MNAIDAQNTNAVRKAIATTQSLSELNGYSNPLFMAIGAENPDPEIVKLLLDAGANPNSKVYGGMTPISLAIQQKNIPIVKLLLDAGANTDVAFSFIFYYNSFDLDQMGEEILDQIQILLQAGLDPNLEDKDGKTLLIHAAHIKDSKITQLLLEAGADPNKIASHTGETPLHIAAEHNNIKTVQLLMNAKADPTARDFANRSVLDLATNDEVINLLQMQTGNNKPNKNAIKLPQTYEEALQSDVVVNCANKDAHIPARFALPLVSMVLGEGDDAASVFSEHLKNFNVFVCFPEWNPSPSTKMRFLENVQEVINRGRRDKLLVVADFTNTEHMEVFKRVFAERAKYILVEGHGMPMSYLDSNAVLATGGTYRNDNHVGRGRTIIDDIRRVLDPLENHGSLHNFQFISRFSGVSDDDLKKLIKPFESTMKELIEITKIPVHVSYVFRPIDDGIINKLEFKLMANVIGLLYDLAHNEYGPDMQAYIGTTGTRSDKILIEVSKGRPLYRFYM